MFKSQLHPLNRSLIKDEEDMLVFQLVFLFRENCENLILYKKKKRYLLPFYSNRGLIKGYRRELTKKGGGLSLEIKTDCLT